jgi:GNAT superfamily N-acetyltransferase
VLPEFMNQGVAKALWLHTRSICELNGSYAYWVRSSTVAIPVYQSFGFELCGELDTNYGITYQQMKLENTRP